MKENSNERARLSDTFRGDNAKLIACIEALLKMDADGILRPHGVGGHARGFLSAAAVRLAATLNTATRAQAPDSAVDAWISVEDRLPDEEIEVLATGWAWNDKTKGRYQAIGLLVDGGWFKSEGVSVGEELHPPSHWMPLPDAPSAHATNK